MAGAKINIEVGVNGGAFDAFRAKFAAYADKLDATPGAWARVSKSSEESAVHFEAMAAAISDQAEAIGKMAAGSTALRQNTEATARHWHGLNISTKGVASNIKEATVSLLKWGAVIASAMTVGAAGGTAYLAPIVGGNRTAAMGLGATYGGRQSFLTNFARITDPEGFLSRVSDISHRADNVPLRALGLTQQQSQGDTADVGANAILQLKRLVDNVKDPRFLADTLRARRADELISINQAQILRGMSPKEVQELVAAYRRDKSRLALGGDTTKKYQDFATRMSAASKKIENTFVKNLGQLTPGLTKLATSAERVVDVLMQKDGPLSQWLAALNKGVEWLAENIDTPEFHTDVENFVKWVGGLASATGSLLASVVSFAQWIGVTPAEAATSQQQGMPGINGMTPHSGGGGGTGIGGGGATGPSYGGGGLGGGMATGKRAGWGDTSDQQVVDTLADVEREEGLPSGTLRGIYAGEGRSGFVGDHGTSFNWGQFHRAPNGKAMGDEMVRAGVNIYDNSPEGVRKTARWLARELKRHPGRISEFHGNRGAGAGQQLRPSQTTPRAPANTSTRITITKPTGSDASTAAAAAVQ
jgi:hypothetical protein